MQNNQKEIFFHVGTGKTGTTFLQYRVFPFFKGIHYIQRTKYKNAIRIIKSGTHDRYLVSREFDQQLEYEVKNFSAELPNTTPIIVFRKHDSYIASQYRRFVKNGFQGGFEKFFDLKNDDAFFKHRDLDYSHQIKILEKYFDRKPLVFIYEDMRKDPVAFINAMAKEMNVTIDMDDVNLNRKHTSYNQNQLKAILWTGKFINLRKRRVFKSGLIHFFWKLHLEAIRYSVLYVSKLFPERAFSGDPLISKSDLEAIANAYQKDWENVLEYANRRKKKA